jgi:CBS domain-containing protein
MKVAEVMTRGVDPVHPSATVQEAATQMAELDVGALLVGTAEQIDGILTDRDILLRLVVDARSSAEVLVRDVMSSRLFTCREDDSVESALLEMRERQIRRMPVADDTGRVIGIVTLGDLAKAVEGPEQIEEILRRISEPHRGRSAPEPDEPLDGKGEDKATAA